MDRGERSPDIQSRRDSLRPSKIFGRGKDITYSNNFFCHGGKMLHKGSGGQRKEESILDTPRPTTARGPQHPRSHGFWGSLLVKENL